MFSAIHGDAVPSYSDVYIVTLTDSNGDLRCTRPGTTARLRVVERNLQRHINGIYYNRHSHSQIASAGCTFTAPSADWQYTTVSSSFSE